MNKWDDKMMVLLVWAVFALLLLGAIVFITNARGDVEPNVREIVELCRQYERTKKGMTLLDDNVFVYIESQRDSITEVVK